jgi:hypothetical protein
VKGNGGDGRGQMRSGGRRRGVAGEQTSNGGVEDDGGGGGGRRWRTRGSVTNRSGGAKLPTGTWGRGEMNRRKNRPKKSTSGRVRRVARWRIG